MSGKWIIILFAVCIILAGCQMQINPPRALISAPDTYDAQDAAIAVASNGTKVIAWQECSGTNCRILVNSTRQGEISPPIIFAPGTGNTYSKPDVAVRDNGDIYLVWQNYNMLSHNYDDCYKLIPAGGFFNTNCDALYPHDSFDSSAGPKVASNGDKVYAVYNVVDGSGSALRYRQLYPLDGSDGWVSAHDGTSVLRSQADLVVDVFGYLHVAWLHTISPGNNMVFRCSNYYGTGNMIGCGSTGLGFYSAPAITMDPEGDYEYHTYVKYGLTSDRLEVYACNNDGTIGYRPELNMDSSLIWSVYGVPDIAADSSQAYIVFSAANNDTGGISNAEIFYAQYEGGTLDWPPVFRLTDNTYMDGAPKLVMVETTITPLPVTVWRNALAPYTDGFVHSLATGTRQVFASPPGGGGTFDLAAGGEYVGSVWIDNVSVTDAQLVPWISFNTVLQFMTVIMR